MIGKEMQEAINRQINEEFYSAYLYLAMSGYFESSGLSGFAQWMYVQYKEEIEHGMKFWRHLVDRGGTIKLHAIKEPPNEWPSPLPVFQAAHKHERYITGKIHGLVDLAEQEKDRAAANMLQWYVDEQVEEEASAQEIITKLEMVKDSGHGMLLVDRELGQRQDAPAE